MLIETNIGISQIKGIMSKSESFFFFLMKWKNWEEGSMEGRYSETLSRRYTHRGV